MRIAQFGLLAWLFLAIVAADARANEPLPSWNAGPARDAILKFVDQVSNPESPDFVPVEQRIAVFDNDGTLWCEQPMYVQGLFMIDRIKALASEHPEWKDQQPFAAVLGNDLAAMKSFGKHEAIKLLAATHSGMTTDEFSRTVSDWLETARHPRFERPMTALVYQPMLEVLAFLREHGFKTFIVSGGGVDFMRVFAEQAYGVPPEQVIGSTGKTRFEFQDGKPVLLKLPDVGAIDDGPGKPEHIERQIGRRPLMAFGNSDGDLQMLQWTTMAPGPRFGLIVHHTDAEREYAYDRQSPVGRLDKALDLAKDAGWVVTDMKTDWKAIFPDQGSSRSFR